MGERARRLGADLAPDHARHLRQHGRPDPALDRRLGRRSRGHDLRRDDALAPDVRALAHGPRLAHDTRLVGLHAARGSGRGRGVPCRRLCVRSIELLCADIADAYRAASVHYLADKRKSARRAIESGKATPSGKPIALPKKDL